MPIRLTGVKIVTESMAMEQPGLGQSLYQYGIEMSIMVSQVLIDIWMCSICWHVPEYIVNRVLSLDLIAATTCLLVKPNIVVVWGSFRNFVAWHS